MQRLNPLVLPLLAIASLLFCTYDAAAQSRCLQNTSISSPDTAASSDLPLFAAPRWWEDTMTWIRNLGWDRGRLVQLWLFFMLIGLYVILRIKPRA